MKIIRAILFFSIIYSLMSSAFALRVTPLMPGQIFLEPKFYTQGADGKLYDSFDAAFAVLPKDYWDGDMHVQVVDVKPLDWHINGAPGGYNLRYRYCSNNFPCSEGIQGFGSVIYECPRPTGNSIVTGELVGEGPGLNDVEYACRIIGFSEPSSKECPVGNPILASSGIKRQIETDFENHDHDNLSFVRTYRSDRKGWENNYGFSGVDLTAGKLKEKTGVSNCFQGIGNNTGLPICFTYVKSTSSPTYDFMLRRANGDSISFGNNNNFNPRSDVNDRIAKLADSIGWKVYNASDDSHEFYNNTGSLIKIVSRNGNAKLLTYSDASTPISIAPAPDLLIEVKNTHNSSIKFTYDANGKMVTMSDPAGGLYKYAYDENTSIVLPGGRLPGNLTSIIFPDGKRKLYWYNEQDKTSNTDQPYALTGITDENGRRFATFQYNSTGQAISTEHANGVNKYTFLYPALKEKSVVTDPLGTTRNYYYGSVLGKTIQTGQDQPSGSGCAAAASSVTYDGNGNISSRRDFNGVFTLYNYDLSRNLEAMRAEAAGTANGRTTSTEWHPTYRLPVRIAEPSLLTTLTYDLSGNLLTRTLQPTTDATGGNGFNVVTNGAPRKWAFTYNALGQLLTATGPRSDIVDVTTATYDANGNLATMATAAGQVTSFTNYDANGRLLSMSDPNGLTTTMTYSPRGWLLTSSVKSATLEDVQTTQYTYDGVGQLRTATFPDGRVISYTYDSAHRLTDLADNAGNNIAYSLNNLGLRTGETVTDAGGVLARSTQRIYDALGRLQAVTGGMQ